MTRTSPSYVGLRPASARASTAARGSSRKTDTSCEVLLRLVLWRHGLRYRKNVRSLPGIPDIVFTKARVTIFCDGDFWHGNQWHARRAKLSAGTNSAYWISKIERNIQRDRANDEKLSEQGWIVVRVWESELRADVEAVTARIMHILQSA